eukprot:3059609-Rhodomonas_salina.3
MREGGRVEETEQEDEVREAQEHSACVHAPHRSDTAPISTHACPPPISTPSTTHLEGGST